MTRWAGHRSTEFGVYPVELDFSLDSHSGPAWVVPALFNRSGWLAVAEVEMDTEFDCTRAVVAACINDQGEVLGQWVVDALFSMQCSLPREAVTEPPDDLAAALDALYWDFLGRCDLEHLRALEEKEGQIASAINRLELRRKDVYEKVDRFLSGLYARRRRERDRADLCTRIEAKIEEIEVKQSETELWHRNQLAALQAELEAFDQQVLSSLQNHGQFQPLYTVHWQTRHSKVRTIGNTGFQMRFGLPRSTSQVIDIASIELDARLHRMERLERKRREFDDYYQALEEALAESKAQGESVRQIGEALKQDRLKERDGRPKGRRSKKDRLEQLAARSRASEESNNGVVTKWQAPSRVERPKIKFRPVPAGTNVSLPTRSKSKMRKQPVKKADAKPVSVDCVGPGDQVLLRYVDPPGARIRFTLTGDENCAAQGILALHDERAEALLGKRVGDRISLLVNQTYRIAEIESISKPVETAR